MYQIHKFALINTSYIKCKISSVLNIQYSAYFLGFEVMLSSPVASFCELNVPSRDTELHSRYIHEERFHDCRR
jgi:hypothetical protein